MLLILISLIAVTALGIYGNTQSRYMSLSVLCEFICPVVAVLGFIGLCFYALIAFDYLAAEHKANIINREYGSSYSQLEVFYASDVIDTVRELNRKRIEVNGDLITGE